MDAHLIDDAENFFQEEEARFLCVFWSPHFDDNVFRVFDELDESFQISEAVLGASVPLVQVQDVAFRLPVDMLPQARLDPGEEDLEMSLGLDGGLEEDAAVNAFVVAPILQRPQSGQSLGKVEAGKLVFHVPVNMTL